MILIFASLDLYGQFYPAKVYSIRDGMPTNAIYDITQSEDGYMWFLTAKGVAYYNSLDWQLFPDSLSLPNTAYSVIKTSNDGTIWVAGQNNSNFVIKYYANKVWHQVKFDSMPEIPTKFAFDVAKVDEGYDIILCHDQKAYTYNTASKKSTSRIVLETKNFSINATTIKDQKTYIATTMGLLTLDSTVHLHPVNSLIPGDNEIIQFRWKNDDLYLLGIGWLGVYKDGKFTYLSTDTGIEIKSHLNKHNLTIDQFDRVFYGSNSPAKYLNKELGTGKTLFVNGRIFNSLSNRIYVDIENNVWVGDHRGLFKFNVLRFKNYNENTDLADDEVAAVLPIGDKIIIANARHLNILKDGSVVKKIKLEGNRNTRILDMAAINDKEVYIAANNIGLLKYDGRSIRKIDWDGPLKDFNVTAVETVDDLLFFSSFNALFMMKDDEVLSEIAIPNIRNLQRINSDSIAATTFDQGVVIFDLQSKVTKQFLAVDRNYNSVYDFVTWKGKKYVATAGGLAFLAEGEIKPVILDSKLTRVPIYSLLVSKNNQLWMGSNEGIFIWNGTTLTNYNKSYGLVGDEVNRNAFVEDEQNNIWIGTEMGLSVYNYAGDLSLNIKPKLELRSAITQNGTNLLQETQPLAYDDNTVEFSFLGISFFDEQQITYRYKLEGFDKDWVTTDNPRSNSVRYTNLSPGKYKFIVESGINSTNWSAPISLEIQIDEAFYASNFFIISIIICSLLLLYLIYRIRFYVLLKRQRKLQLGIKSRTEEIQRMNEEIQAQNEALKTQSEEIVSTNELLEITVFERTRQLREQNQRLSEYAFINSHQLRAPICRMIGLLNLLAITGKEEHPALLKLIHKTGIELDQVSREINNKLDTVDFSRLEELNSIEVLNAKQLESSGKNDGDAPSV